MSDMLENLRWKLGLEPGAKHRLKQTIKSNTKHGLNRVKRIEDGPRGKADIVLDHNLDIDLLSSIVDEYDPFLDHKDEEQLIAERDGDTLEIYRMHGDDKQHATSFTITEEIRIDQVPMNKSDPLSLQLDLVTEYLDKKTN